MWMAPCPDDVVEEVDTQNRVVRNYLKMPSLHRKDHDDVLSCVASNTNLTARPQITYININMVCKYLFCRPWPFIQILSLIRCGPTANPNPKWIFGMWM